VIKLNQPKPVEQDDGRHEEIGNQASLLFFLPFLLFCFFGHQVNKMMDDMKKMGIKPPY
jgi:hypothetical protein